MKKVFFCLALVLLSGSLSACSGVKKKLGLENSAPDEFLVTSRAPLSLPPEYDLRPVTDGSSVSPGIKQPDRQFQRRGKGSAVQTSLIQAKGAENLWESLKHSYPEQF